MSIEVDLVLTLTLSSSVSAVVGRRVYPLLMPQDAKLPAITYSRVSNSPSYSVNGYSDLDNARIQIDCWGSTYAETKSLSAIVRREIDNSTMKGILLDDRDMYEDDTKVYRSSMDFSFWGDLNE